jgi:hypothetical protein
VSREPHQSPACTGSCACGGRALPIVPAPVPLPLWQLPDGADDFHTPADSFVAEVIRRPSCAPGARIDAARTYAGVHGLPALERVLDGLGDELPPELSHALAQTRARLASEEAA